MWVGGCGCGWVGVRGGVVLSSCSLTVLCARSLQCIVGSSGTCTWVGHDHAAWMLVCGVREASMSVAGRSNRVGGH